MADNARWEEVSAQFDRLVELPAHERRQCLDELAARDAALAAEVRAMLDADERASLLDAAAAAVMPDLLVDGAPADRRAGAYRLLRVIGEGGMGVVWLGERGDGAFEQRVAVKVLKRGMDTQAILRRFLQERRILARLHHPHVVRLLDGGMSGDGRPFYVMDHVDGVTLTAYAARERLDVVARVALLAKVAEAVAYAHAQLVVHRDLKPSNVLVDAGGEPRVLDFGIAKLLEESGEQTRTGTGLRVLSPAYAAPEQILGEAIGTATDVYALGLLLCELLVGRLPRQRSSAPAQLAQDAADETSERASALAARLAPTEVDALYGSAMEAKRLAQALAGDLDLIVATALQRDPARRYPTAAAFADDLRRWLGRRPIAARADSASYRCAQFVRRHCVGVAASAVVAASLVAGLGTALWQAGVARREAQRADAERVHAERQLARTERVKDFMLTLFREQDPVSRARAQARSASQLIGDGIAQIDATLDGEPDLKAELLRDLGEIQINLDDSKAGVATLARAWELQKRLGGADSLAATEALVAYADGVYASGDVQAAAPLVDAAIGRLRALGAARGARMAQAESTAAKIRLIQGDGEAAERFARDAIDIVRALHGSHSVELVAPLETLGKVLHEGAHLEQALAVFREAIGIVEAAGGADAARAAVLHMSVGDALRVQRKYDQALPEYETALRIERAQLPHDHVILGGTLIRLGDLQRRTGHFDAADASLAEAIGILAKTPSGQYAQALQFHGNLARAQGRFELAAQRYRASFEAFRAVTGDSVYTWLTALEVVSVLAELGRLDEADALATQAIAAMAKLSGDDSYEAAYVASVVGTLRHAQHRLPDAIAARRRAVVLIEKAYGPDHAEVAQARAELAASLVATNDPALRSEAGMLLEHARASLERGGEETAEPMLGFVYLVRSHARRDGGDRAGARADIAQAIARLQAPEHALRLREALALSRQLGAG
ncbi:MAG TPA: protein kinase [Dokdonella sp.]|nr:protein kinase [Dokdonella sp.]